MAEDPTGGNDCLDDNVAGWLEEIACTAKVEGTEVAGEFLWMLGLGIEGLLTAFVTGNVTGVFGRLPAVDGFCAGMNSTLPDCWLVTNVPVVPWRICDWLGIATGTCKMTGKDWRETDIGWVLLVVTWLFPTTVAVLGGERTEGMTEEEVTGGLGLDCALWVFWALTVKVKEKNKSLH